MVDSTSNRPKEPGKIKTILQTIADEQHNVAIDGNVISQTNMEVLLRIVQRHACEGNMKAIEWIDRIATQFACEPDGQVGCLLVGPQMTMEEAIEAMEEHKRYAKDPTLNDGISPFLK